METKSKGTSLYTEVVAELAELKKAMLKVEAAYEESQAVMYHEIRSVKATRWDSYEKCEPVIQAARMDFLIALYEAKKLALK